MNDNGTSQSRAYGWNIGFGLQQVDGLTPSRYALDVARRNIQGAIDYAQAAQELSQYHAANPREHIHREADLVAQRISQLLQAPSMPFDPCTLRAIHTQLFRDILPDPWAERWRQTGIRKNEPVLGGDTVPYTPPMFIETSLEWDFHEEQQRQQSYPGMDTHTLAYQVFDFISGIWQIHPFREGNTRTTAVFSILYLRQLGFTVDDQPFAQHSRYLRNALVLANAPEGFEKTTAPLHVFVNAMLFDKNTVLPDLRAN